MFFCLLSLSHGTRWSGLQWVLYQRLCCDSYTWILFDLSCCWLPRWLFLIISCRSGQWERHRRTATSAPHQECANQQPDRQAEVLLHMQDLQTPSCFPLQHLRQLRGWVNIPNIVHYKYECYIKLYGLLKGGVLFILINFLSSKDSLNWCVMTLKTLQNIYLSNKLYFGTF